MKKSAKTTRNVKSTKSKQVMVVHSPAQRFWGMLALAGLFVCGIMVGFGLNEPASEPVTIPVAENLLLSPENISFDDVALGGVYEKYVRVSAPAPVKILAIRQSKDMSEMSVDTDCTDVELDNASEGCVMTIKYAPITEVYSGKNVLIIDWMSADGVVHNTGVGVEYSAQKRIINPDRICEHVENAMLERLPDEYEGMMYDDRILRAQVYANLSERGCPENVEFYVKKAEQELAIARALTDDEFTDIEKAEVSETYKRLNMQAVADEIFDTARKLTNPAIDFVLEVEKVINEK